MAEKVYQLNSEQIGVVKFDTPWFLVHFEIEEEPEPFQMFFPTIELGIKHFAPHFIERVIEPWLKLGPEGEAKIARLREYVLTTWWNPGVETMREAMYKQYGFAEFKEKSGKDLINDGYDFLAVTIGHIVLRHNKMHFYFEGLHVSARVVDSFLAVNFWDKVKKEIYSSST
ncbi:hypothetical protein SCLARK_001418 [Spiroplasma clarkii]|uniref:Uncharacterized protein n=1 Tax=Spiroplasma clarkii TaxID=2139 RepID=A0A1Y0L1T9_9MOLU|nr:hypothetical protein [Spiroplasma clarkii]ARU91943.1 hypothetical protein SCLARK_001418 [Spiroplasma clarkii]ATX71285.1 hypothetical protein SCLAR_v1c09830 [Spiroplasma clarkii]